MFGGPREIPSASWRALNESDAKRETHSRTLVGVYFEDKNTNFEARNPKQFRIANDRTRRPSAVRFGDSEFETWKLFRVSEFGLRNSA
jgi:hypothetical protein